MFQYIHWKHILVIEHICSTHTLKEYIKILSTHTSNTYLDIINTYLQNICFANTYLNTYLQNILPSTHTWTHRLNTYSYENISWKYTLKTEMSEHIRHTLKTYLLNTYPENTAMFEIIPTYLWNHTRVLRESQHISWNYMGMFSRYVFGYVFVLRETGMFSNMCSDF